MDARQLECRICKKTFTQKSSLVRHTKRCTPGPSPSLRQKSCRWCTGSKVRCDLQRPTCSRCLQRDLACEYVIPLTRNWRSPSASGFSRSLDGSTNSASASPPSAPDPQPPPVFAQTDSFSQFLFSHNDPFPNVSSSSLGADLALTSFADQSCSPATNTPEINNFGNDWTNLPFLEQLDSTPPLARHSMEVLLRVMKTWPKMLAKEFQPPPLLHTSQMYHILTNQNPRILPEQSAHPVPQPLANCFTISKMWAGQCEGASGIVTETVTKEMESLFEKYRTMNEPDLLAALQALVLYTVMLLFPSHSQSSLAPVAPSVFASLQKVVYYVASTGLVLQEERDHIRPSWDSWIYVTSKRRAVFSLYLLHWSYSVYNGLPSFSCAELGFMPAPAPKFLWEAASREVWEAYYIRWLAQWGGEEYMMREFQDVETQQGPTVDARTGLWLEDADELGILFFSIGGSNPVSINVQIPELLRVEGARECFVVVPPPVRCCYAVD
ncbi:uncharacterized protein BDZ99DRAFT_391543 [Mytilinidion resinicola]|uniref:Zn(2)-C6 fungal-type domain-containing protein n=1 Tax=Mytilinidion resinicola TaxID=574789 RepID=A0A6A6YHJ7_9PEZI|nr:uncharacterized protein BDZ99DRAFT_391543 [Mytilinidion resinicola]KAF2808058.1 hypothetical protein BDZ99DRAFT_391543 [Mytilinidion resinicola]